MAICFKTVWCFFSIENEGPLWWFLLGDSERSEDGSKWSQIRHPVSNQLI
jgi:hypothetical protein